MSEEKTPLSELDKFLAIQMSDGNWNFNPYMHGLTNGLIFARSCLTGEAPQYVKAPAEWTVDQLEAERNGERAPPESAP